MKTIFSILLTPLIIFFFLAPFSLSAQEASIYYRIIHPETGATSFILGTYHNYPQGWYDVPDQVKRDLSKTTALITEMGDFTSFKKPEKLAQAVRYKKGKTVLDKMNKKQRTKFQAYLDGKIGGTETAKLNVLNHKPYFINSKLFGLRFSDSVMSMEGELKALAIKQGLPIMDLEPDEKRILKIAKKYGRKINIQSIELFIEPTMISTAVMFKNYLDNELISPKNKSKEASPEAIKRNHYWLPQLMAKLRISKFVAVGAGHLIGDHAIQVLLKNQGFTVEAIDLRHPIPESLTQFLMEIEKP